MSGSESVAAVGAEPEQDEVVRALMSALADDADPARARRVAQAAMNLLVRHHASSCSGSPFAEPPPSATETVITVSAMLAAVDVEVFELALWHSWGRT